MFNLPNTTSYSTSFPPATKQRQVDGDRLPVIVPVGFATNFLFGDHRLKKGPALSERLRDARRSISLGLSTPRQFRTIHWSVDKPIVRSLRPQDVPAGPTEADECREAQAVANSDSNETIESVDNEEDIAWDELATKRRFTSVTADAAEEGVMHLPSPPAKPKILSSTCEPDCDPVRNEASWTGWKLPRPISISWDRTHTRVTDGLVTTSKAPTSLPRIPAQSSRPKVTDNTSIQTISKQKLTFYRNDPTPGYTGYWPRLPIVVGQGKDHMTTVARSSYRTLPLYKYQPPYYPHKAPFSKMVSLIVPYNPFNRIQQIEPLKL